MRYTPSDIVKRNIYFSIPIYQRLFEWDTENIETLLRDLLRSYTQTGDDYFIGMLTATEQTNELVDGQQRFTVMMLLGCVLQVYDNRWKQFLIDSGLRLHFSARPSDENCLRKLIDSYSTPAQQIENAKMGDGVKAIARFIEGLDKERKAGFASYVFDHMCFFISRLPHNYGALDMNKYFERMNSSGKNLEQHEILKVKLLRHLKGDVSRYMQLWNLLADVDTPLISKRRNNEWTESEDELRRRKNDAFNIELNELLSEGCDIINQLGDKDLNDNESIKDITQSPNKPSYPSNTNIDSRCVIRFPQLLLQALYLTLPQKADSENRRELDDTIEDFFDTSNLLETFSKYLPFEGVSVDDRKILNFMSILLRCRLALDICFVRPMEYGYFLDMNRPEDDNEIKELLMLESMLFVSSSNFTHYRWFGWLMSIIDNIRQVPDPQVLFRSLLIANDSINPLPSYESLTYNDNIRYWFWRLDFHIWQHRNIFFSDKPEFLIVAENYNFVRNRSIEHIAPQHPKTGSMMLWKEGDPQDEALMDSFGNLVMISQGLNSALSNASYEVKTAHVQSFCNGASGTIESLKLLYVHKKYRHWDRKTVQEHGKEMYQMLKDALHLSE